jgi:hypothetical protein
VATQSPRHFSIEGEPWQLWIGGKKITSGILHNLYSWVHDKEGRMYREGKSDVSAEAVSLVDWKMLGKAMQTTTRTQRVLITIHTAGMCGVRKFMRRWKECADDKCPRCSEPEDSQHFWICKGPGTAAIWSNALEGQTSLLQKLETDPTLSRILIDYLKGWYSGEGITYEAPREFQNLVNAQKKIGGSRFFEGWLVEYWATIQQRYYSIIRSSRTGKCWAIAIIQKFWDTAWDMWDNRNGILHETENVVTRTMGIHLNRKVSRQISGPGNYVPSIATSCGYR